MKGPTLACHQSGTKIGSLFACDCRLVRTDYYFFSDPIPNRSGHRVAAPSTKTPNSLILLLVDESSSGEEEAVPLKGREWKFAVRQ